MSIVNKKIQKNNSTAEGSYDPITGYYERLDIEFAQHNNFLLETVLMPWFEFPSHFQDFLLENNFRYARVSLDWAFCHIHNQLEPELVYIAKERINYVAKDDHPETEIYPYVVVSQQWLDELQQQL